MAKINRVTQVQFGSDGSVADFGQFGSLATGSPNFTKDPATIQSLQAFKDGLASETIANNRPALEDFNGILLLIFYQLAYLFQSGMPEWDAATTYYTGSIVQVNGLLYKSLQDTNLNQNPTTQAAYWGGAFDIVSGGIPTGTVQDFAGASAPTGFLLCDGSAVSRSTFSTLFALIGTTYGSGNGSTTFNVPNCSGKVTVGKDPSDPTFDNLNDTGGEKTHVLTVPEVPALTLSIPLYSPNSGGSSGVPQNTPGPADTTSSTYTTSGGGGAHNNLQPFIVFNKIIKT